MTVSGTSNHADDRSGSTAPIDAIDFGHRLVPIDIRITHPSARTLTTATGDVGDLLVTDWVCAPSEGVVRSEQTAQQAESLLAFVPSAGRQHVRTAEDEFVLQPGRLLLMSSHAAATFTIPEHLSKRSLKVPAVALAGHGLTGGLPDHLLVETATSPLASVFQDFLTSVSRQLPHMSATEIETARGALLTLLAGIVTGSRADAASTGLLFILRTQLEEWIVAHLEKGPIRLADLARAHNVAPRTVNRAFSSTGETLGGIVRARRLAAARDDLVHSAGTVAAIAHRWGYCDASHLGREFRRTFGSSPGDYREAFGTPLAKAAGRSSRGQAPQVARSS